MALTFTRSLHQFFAGIPLFSRLSVDEVSEILRLSQPFTRQPGEPLFSEGDPADGMYVIERGEVGVLTRGPQGQAIKLAYLGNGAVVGEMALIDGGQRSASVEAQAMVSGYWFSRSRFLELQTGRNHAAYKILYELARVLEERRRGTAARVRNLMNDPNRATAIASPAVRDLIGRMQKA